MTEEIGEEGRSANTDILNNLDQTFWMFQNVNVKDSHLRGLKFLYEDISIHFSSHSYWSTSKTKTLDQEKFELSFSF